MKFSDLSTFAQKGGRVRTIVYSQRLSVRAEAINDPIKHKLLERVFPIKPFLSISAL